MLRLSVSSVSDAAVIDTAIAILAEASAEQPVLENAEFSEVIRHTEGKKTILRGALSGQPAVFRLYHGADEACQRHWAELQRIWPLMSEGEATICQPLACAPNIGVLAVADVPGTPLLQHFYRTEPDTRARWLLPAARWLRLYTDCSETEHDATAEGWATRAARAASGQVIARLRKLEAPLIDEMHRLASMIDGQPWRVAIGHGDFQPNNIIAGPYPSLTGIDCGGSRKMPIYKDMARFLMHMGRRGMIPSGEKYLGVDRMGLDAFAEGFDLTEKERRLYVPFFLAVEALIRVETQELSKSRIRRAVEMTEALLEDIRQIAR
ncbi:MAG: phosphotransferase [Pseudomonadota bacterium]